MKYNKYEFRGFTYIDVVTDKVRTTVKRFPFGDGEWYFHTDKGHIPTDSWIQASNSMALLTCKFEEEDLLRMATSLKKNDGAFETMYAHIQYIKGVKEDPLFFSKLAAYFLFDYNDNLGINPFVRNKQMYDRCTDYIDKLSIEDKQGVCLWFIEYYGETLKHLKSIAPLMYSEETPERRSAIDIFTSINESINSHNELLMSVSEMNVAVFDHLNKDLGIGDLFGSINLKLKLNQELNDKSSNMQPL